MALTDELARDARRARGSATRTTKPAKRQPSGLRATIAATVLHFVVAVFPTGVAVGCARGLGPRPSSPSPLLERPLPRLDRLAVDGSRVHLGGPTGQVVVVGFFAKHCRPCRRNLPALERLRQARPTVAFVGIDTDEDEWNVRETVRGYQLAFPVIHDRDGALARRFFVREMPCTFVADAWGIVRWVGYGRSHTEGDLRRAIDAPRPPSMASLAVVDAI